MFILLEQRHLGEGSRNGNNKKCVPTFTAILFFIIT